ncbi:YfcZ/YiiS family protein [Celerinatantimonas sp. YJH-8]|uniref:YfcZ/YiiS family protein n=1 Tax=Celerinatantimonas sp. YJH-8 TaxID=3228714 RepID=UPI0038C89DBB
MKSKAEECVACSCVEIGSIIDGSECSTPIEQQFSSKAEAEQALALLTEKVRKAENEPAQIEVEVQPEGDQFKLAGTVTFGCQAENLIFQMSLR